MRTIMFKIVLKKFDGGVVMRLCIFTMVLMLVAGIAYGANIDGKWEGDMDMMGQSMKLGFTFKAAGATTHRNKCGAAG